MRSVGLRQGPDLAGADGQQTIDYACKSLISYIFPSFDKILILLLILLLS